MNEEMRASLTFGIEGINHQRRELTKMQKRFKAIDGYIDAVDPETLGKVLAHLNRAIALQNRAGGNLDKAYGLIFADAASKLTSDEGNEKLQSIGDI